MRSVPATALVAPIQCVIRLEDQIGTEAITGSQGESPKVASQPAKIILPPGPIPHERIAARREDLTPATRGIEAGGKVLDTFEIVVVYVALKVTGAIVVVFQVSGRRFGVTL